MRVWGRGIVVLTMLSCAVSAARVCPKESVTDSILGFRDTNCPLNGFHSVGVTEGDEISLQRALSMVHSNSHDYVALLFYASWCPFSRSCSPTFSMLSSLFPSIPHFAIEESSIRPSVLSKYGVHGFPTLFLINSTMHVRYHGSRTLGSLFAFYRDVTGIKTATLDQASLENTKSSSNHEKHDNSELENCPFSWARSPEKLLRQETYLALATAFVLLRLLYFIFPALRICALYIWRRNIRNMSLGTLWEQPQAYLNGAMQLLNSLKELCKRRNLQGALNARVWASTSLASVSIGDASSSRGVSVSERR